MNIVFYDLILPCTLFDGNSIDFEPNKAFHKQ